MANKKRTPRTAESFNEAGDKAKVKLTEGEKKKNTAGNKIAKMMDRADSIGDIFPSAAAPEDKLMKELKPRNAPEDADAMLAAKMAYNEQAKPAVVKPGKTPKGKSTK